jgi:hypothetical protein
MQEHPPLLFALPTGVVLDDRLIISVSQGEIEVILPGTDFRAVYYKSTGETQLFAKSPPNGNTSSEHALGGRPAKWRGNSGGLCSCAVHLSCGGSRNAKAWEMETAPAEADATQARRLHSPSGHQWSPAW